MLLDISCDANNALVGYTTIPFLCVIQMAYISHKVKVITEVFIALDWGENNYIVYSSTTQMVAASSLSVDIY